MRYKKPNIQELRREKLAQIYKQLQDKSGHRAPAETPQPQQTQKP